MHQLSLSDQFVSIPKGMWDGMSHKDGLTGNCLLIYAAIMQNFPRMYPSVKTICARTGLHRQTVFKYLKRLEEMKVIKRFRRLGTSNLYQLSPHLLAKKVKTKSIDAFEKLKAQWLGKKNRTTPDLTCPRYSDANQNKDLSRGVFEKIGFTGMQALPI